MVETTGVSAQQLAYRHIRDGILDGTHRGGTWLKSQKIAVELGISRIPVREALRQLDVEGLVTLRLNRGALVTELTPEDVDDLFQMRAVLMALACGLAAPSITEEAIAELDRLCRDMDAARRDVNLWIERHNAFHDYLCGLSGRQRMLGEIARLRALLQPYLRMYFDLSDDPALHYEHEAVMDAVRSRNPKVLEIVLKDHVVDAGRSLVAFLRDHQPASQRRRRSKRLVAA